MYCSFFCSMQISSSVRFACYLRSFEFVDANFPLLRKKLYFSVFVNLWICKFVDPLLPSVHIYMGANIH